MIAGTPKTNGRAYIIESCDGTSQPNNGHSKKTSAPPNQYYLIRQAITTITAAISNSIVSHHDIYVVSAHKRLDPAAGARFHAARRPCVACGCL